MDLHEQHTEIEQYLDNEMPDQERLAFEKRLQTQPELAKAFSEYQKAQAAIRVYEQESLKNIKDKSEQIRGWIKEIDEEEEHEKPKRNIRSIWYKNPVWLSSIAAGLAILIIFSIPPIRNSIFPPPAPDNGYAIFTKYFELPYDNRFLGPGADSTRLDSLWGEAKDTFSEGDCAAAIEMMQALLQEPEFKTKAEAHLYTGTCLLKGKQTNTALEHLRAIKPISGRTYQDAQWYIALSYLQIEDKAKALDAFTEIAKEKGNGRSKKAGEIRDLLD